MSTLLDRIKAEEARVDQFWAKLGAKGGVLAEGAAAKSSGAEIDEAAAELADAGNAERFRHRHGSDVRFVPAWGWMVWTGTHWAKDELKARSLMLETACAIHHEAASQPDTKQQAAVAKWARASQQAQRIQGALWCAQPALAARTDDFDRDHWLLPVANGTLDLRSGDLHGHCREDYCTRLAPVHYDAAAECPIWLAFLARVLPDDEVRAFVQRLVGYSLTGLTTEQVLAFLYGVGRNGKSVFLETLAALLGDYHKPTRVETISVTRGGGIPNDIAALAGARLVTVSETPEGGRLNESLVKDLTGGDTITARFLNREFFTFRPQFKLWIRGNHKPQIRGTDDGIWRRFALVPFTVQIPLEEVDPNLLERLRAELPGILAWAVRGCLAWQKDGLRPPDAVTAAVQEYRTEMDTLGEFIEDCCLIAPHAKAQSSALYGSYQKWCEESGHHPVTKTRFGTALGERGFERHKPKTIVWHGIGLLSDSSDSCDPFRSYFQSRARSEHEPEKGSQLSATVGLSDSTCPKCFGDGSPCYCNGGAP